MSQRKPGSFPRQLSQPLEDVSTIDQEVDAIRASEARREQACAEAVKNVLREKPMMVLTDAMLSNPAIKANLPPRRPPIAPHETYEPALEAYLQSLRACVPPRLAEMIERARRNKQTTRETPLADEIVVLFCQLEFAGVPLADVSRKIELRLGCDRIHVRKVIRDYGISLKAMRQQIDEC